jgi:hypothetical protein
MSNGTPLPAPHDAIAFDAQPRWLFPLERAGAIHPGRFDNIVKFFQHCGAEGIAPGEFAALVRMNARKIESGGALDLVRKAHTRREAPSTTRRYAQYPSKEVMTRSVVLSGRL